MKTSSTVALLLLSVFADLSTASCAHGTSLLRRKVTVSKRAEGEAGVGEVKKVEVGKFGYIATQGPTNWAGLDPANSACATSTKQSPIDVTNQTTTILPPGALAITIPTVEAAEFENIGTTIEVVMEGKGGKTVVAGKTFELKQFHFHTPSEHTINGEYFPLEMHMVHENAEDKSIAVIAAQFQLSEVAGETTSLLTSVVEKIGAISAPGTVTETGPLDFAPLINALSTQSMHTYAGSLTTPPCAEGLTFFITTQQLPLDVATFNKIKAVVGFNARFTQNNVGAPNLLVESSKLVVAAEAQGVIPGATGETKTVEGEASKVEVGVATPSIIMVNSEGVVTSGAGARLSGSAAEIVKSLTGVDLKSLGLKEKA